LDGHSEIFLFSCFSKRVGRADSLRFFQLAPVAPAGAANWPAVKLRRAIT